MVEWVCQACWHSGKAQILAQTLLSRDNHQSIHPPNKKVVPQELRGAGETTHSAAETAAAVARRGQFPFIFPLGNLLQRQHSRWVRAEGCESNIPHSHPAWHLPRQPSQNSRRYLLHPEDTEEKAQPPSAGWQRGSVIEDREEHNLSVTTRVDSFDQLDACRRRINRN